MDSRIQTREGIRTDENGKGKEGSEICDAAQIVKGNSIDGSENQKRQREMMYNQMTENEILRPLKRRKKLSDLLCKHICNRLIP